MTNRRRRPLRLGLPAAAALALCLHTGRASALQPVAEFLEHARTWNPQNRAAHATTAQRDAEVSVSMGNLLPNLQAQGTYTRNQYEVTTAALIPSTGTTLPFTIPNTVIQPLNQLDANITLTVPILHIGDWDRRDVAKATLTGAQASEANADLQVRKNVLRDYFTLLGDEAVLLSATKNAEVAQHNLQLARDRKESGTGSELDVQRSLADQAKAAQSVTAAVLAVTNTRHDLYSLSGLVPEPASAFPEDDLHDEPGLEQFTGKTSELPSVQSAAANRMTAEEQVKAAKGAWLPSVDGRAEERFTNATAFIGGHSAVYLLQLEATWKLDTTLSPLVRAQNAAAAAARASEDEARKDAEDAVFRDWQQVHADIESARSARVQVTSALLAASLAQDRYENGVATQLDVLQARQDAFSADVSRIQADADLAYARLALRLDAGLLPKETR
jgi:outer membrane protein TolC